MCAGKYLKQGRGPFQGQCGGVACLQAVNLTVAHNQTADQLDQGVRPQRLPALWIWTPVGPGLEASSYWLVDFLSCLVRVCCSLAFHLLFVFLG